MTVPSMGDVRGETKAFLQKADLVGALNMGLIWGFMLLFYAVGYFVALNHYR